SGTTRDVCPDRMPTTRTGTAWKTVDSRALPKRTVTVACATDAETPAGSCSDTRRVTSARAALISTGLGAALSTPARVEVGPVSATVSGSVVALVTVSAGEGVPVIVGTIGTTLLMMPSRTASVMSTIFGVTCTPDTGCPLASVATTGRDATTCWRSGPV